MNEGWDRALMDELVARPFKKVTASRGKVGKG